MLKTYKKYLKKHFVISKNIIYKIRMEKLTIVEIFFNQPWQPKYLPSKMFLKNA